MIRFIILSAFLSISLSAKELPKLDLSSPRASFRTFLKSMVLVKKNQDTNKAYSRALKVLSLDHFDPKTRELSGRLIADQFIDILDKSEKINYQDIARVVSGSVWVYSPKNNITQWQIIFTKDNDERWKINKETIRSIPLLYEKFHNQKRVRGIIKFNSYKKSIKSLMPDWMNQHFLFLKLGQWSLIVVLICLALIIKSIAGLLLSVLIQKQFIKVPERILKSLSSPVGSMISLTFILFTLPLIEFSDQILAFWVKAIYIALSILSIWLGLGFVNIASLFFNKIVTRTQTKVDNILVPLVAKILNGFIIIMGIILIAHSLNIDVNNLLAGLGIGAMAFAFAAKDTLANFFGSIMIVLDRPFDLGDYITADGMTGTVEEVGFRSTRLRSSQDSIISIPNGQLANANIDNFGRRRFRRSDIVLGIEYDTTPEKIETFCEGLREIISKKDWIKSDDSLVYFDSFGDFSLNINIKFFIMTQGFSTAALYKHEILVDFLELGNKIEIGFAFPTQTLHLKSEV